MSPVTGTLRCLADATPEDPALDVAVSHALLTHVATYTLAFVPAGIWLAGGDHALAAGGLALLAVGIYVPHMIQDDGRLLSRYITTVKGCGAESFREVFTAVDQSFHLITLFATALIVHGAVT